MWNRRDLKAKARVAFKRNYWLCVLAGLLLAISIGSGGSVAYNFSMNSYTYSNDYETEDYSYDEVWDEMEKDIASEFGIDNFNLETVLTGMAIGMIVLLGIVFIIKLALKLFILGPLEVGCYNFYKKNAYENGKFDSIGIGFKNENYKNVIFVMFLRHIFTFFWTLLFIIPGIVKAYEYRMIPFLLSDCPDMSRKDAFRISKDMMRGNKMDAFLLDLSFIGWRLLAIPTCCILSALYVQPYIAATDAELFIAIREEYFAKQRAVSEQSEVVCE